MMTEKKEFVYRQRKKERKTITANLSNTMNQERFTIDPLGSEGVWGYGEVLICPAICVFFSILKTYEPPGVEARTGAVCLVFSLKQRK